MSTPTCAMKINHIPQGESNQCAPIRRLSQLLLLLFPLLVVRTGRFFSLILFTLWTCFSVPFIFPFFGLNVCTMVNLLRCVPLQLAGFGLDTGFRLEKHIRTQARYGARHGTT